MLNTALVSIYKHCGCTLDMGFLKVLSQEVDTGAVFVYNIF
jgi:hypothetical protein